MKPTGVKRRKKDIIKPLAVIAYNKVIDEVNTIWGKIIAPYHDLCITEAKADITNPNDSDGIGCYIKCLYDKLEYLNSNGEFNDKQMKATATYLNDEVIKLLALKMDSVAVPRPSGIKKRRVQVKIPKKLTDEEMAMYLEMSDDSFEDIITNNDDEAYNLSYRKSDTDIDEIGESETANLDITGNKNITTNIV
ncbi:hypothetical protein RN001_011385 [Aquatica leii]|uniref:Uncharacterized protein n=1 Tax=Aquatica leii TaxID=1421715 RepID=A0AAN7SGM1_9COLE|nr:hypothetical protein RN001_011385 [Aquatica leii]